MSLVQGGLLFSVFKVLKLVGLYLVEPHNLFYEQEKKNHLTPLVYARKIKLTSTLCTDS